MNADFAKRAWDHRFALDPIVRSLLGSSDIYKLLIAQFALASPMRDVPVAFEVRVRTPGVRLVDAAGGEAALRAQLDHARTVGLTRTEEAWLAGNTFFGRGRIFSPEFLAWLRGFRLGAYELAADPGTGDAVLRFRGSWAEASMWEIPALAVLSELRAREALRGLGQFALDAVYARAKALLWDKIDRLARLGPGLMVADFSTRRRHGFLWQDYAVRAAAGALGSAFVGTSNPLLAMRHDIEAIGTNAHEMPMLYAAVRGGGGGDAALRDSQYEVLRDWERVYGGNLLVMLPDTFGTTQFLRGAPPFLDAWTGVRVDSKDPAEAGEEYLDWVASRGGDPASKRLIFSDGLDVGDIERLHARFSGRCRVGFGWGTLLANDFRVAGAPEGLRPLSIVCKPVEAGGRPCVKLSDNPAKAMGPADEVARYRRAFGHAAGAARPALV